MKKTNLLFAICSLLFAGTARAGSDTNYFVDRNGNPRPETAMCIVHAYNIGATVNAAANKEEMDRVVALKATLITREMKRQYDYLDATVKRFEIQLQKAVLVAAAEAAGAPSAASSASANAGGLGITGADNCSGKTRALTVDCLRENYRVLYAAANAGKVDIAFRNQLQSDVRTITSMTYEGDALGGEKVCANFVSEQCNVSKITNKKSALDCLPCISRAIGAIEEYQPKSQKRNNNNEY